MKRVDSSPLSLVCTRDDEYITKVAVAIKGARALLEAGFEYVINMD